MTTPAHDPGYSITPGMPGNDDPGDDGGMDLDDLQEMATGVTTPNTMGPGD
jgi:hypothetical protein